MKTLRQVKEPRKIGNGHKNVRARRQAARSVKSSSDSDSDSERSFGNISRATNERAPPHAAAKRKHQERTRNPDERIPRKKKLLWNISEPD